MWGRELDEKGSNGASTGRPPDLRPEVWRSSLLGAEWSSAGWVTVGARTAARQNPLANDQGETVPSVVPLCQAGRNAPCRQQWWLAGKWTMGGPPLGLGCAGGAVGMLQSFSRRIDTMFILSPICRVKWRPLGRKNNVSVCQLWRWPRGDSCVVSCGRMFGSTQS